jgi:hypothetical protein
MTTASQNAAFLAMLRRGETVTPLDALKAFKCMRLAARRWDLIKAGHDVETVKVHTPGGAVVAGYRLRVVMDGAQRVFA